METIYRFKKSNMVYPEKENQNLSSKKSSLPAWCEPMENNRIPSKEYYQKHKYIKVNHEELETNYQENSENNQFIQDRIRHLVDAFSTRTQVARERIETPGTPSSISSRDTTEPPSSDLHQTPMPVRKQIRTPQKEKTVENQPQTDIKEKFDFFRINRCFGNYVIDPNGTFYLSWMFFVAISVLYNAWVIPLRSTFPYQTKDNRFVWMCFDYFADLVYVLDMIFIQPRVKYLSEGFWVTEIGLLRHNYTKRRQFKLDLFSLAPLDILYVFSGPEFVILRISRFLKVHSFWKFVSFVDKRLKNPYVIRITRTLMYMMYLIHLNACAYYVFSVWEGIGSNNFVYNGRGNAYIKCFYFATKTATSIGKNPKPTQEIEYMFMTVSWLMGVFVFAVLIGQIRDIISTANRSKTEYRKLVNETLEYMRRLNLPIEMQRRAQQWFSYTWKTQRTFDESRILDCLPHKMKTDIAINVHIQTLSKVKLFADCDEALLRELVLQLKSVIYLPGDIICKKGDVGKEMYIIQSGKVQVIGPKNEVLATLSEGSVFGEISLLGIRGKNRRTANVRSQGHSNLFVLSKADLNAALQQYPEAQELLNKKAKQLMKKNAALEQKENDMIVIDNPNHTKQVKLLDTVLQVIPPDSKTNKLLRFGSKAYNRVSKPENERFKSRKSLPQLESLMEFEQIIQTKAMVHRTQS